MKQFHTCSFEDILTELKRPLRTLILFHHNPDADAVGSAYALKCILRALGSDAYCVCADELPARLRFLMTGEQESVLPTSVPEAFSAQRIISVDSASPTQLGSLFSLYGENIDLMIDHHETGALYADHYIRPDAAATGEILFDLVKGLEAQGLIKPTDALRTALYAAISADTGGFRFSNTTAQTHLRAAELLASGIDCAEINHRLFDTNTPEQLRARAAGISNLHLFADGTIAVILFPYALKKSLDLEDEHLEGLVDVARSVLGVKVALAIRQAGEEGIFRVSARSSCAYDVSDLCAAFGGGGHKKAAGCTVRAESAEEAMKLLVDAIDTSALG